MDAILDHMADNPNPIPDGTHGVLDKIDNAGQFWVKWDVGRALPVIPGVDQFRVKSKLGVKNPKYQPVCTQFILPSGAEYNSEEVGCVLNKHESACRMEGCTGARMRVWWPKDNKITHPCTKGCELLVDATPYGEIYAIT